MRSTSCRLICFVMSAKDAIDFLADARSLFTSSAAIAILINVAPSRVMVVPSGAMRTKAPALVTSKSSRSFCRRCAWVYGSVSHGMSRKL